MQWQEVSDHFKLAIKIALVVELHIGAVHEKVELIAWRFVEKMCV